MRLSENPSRLDGTVNATVASITITGLTANRAVATNGSKTLVSSATTATELGYLSGVPGLITATYAPLASPTFTGIVTAPQYVATTGGTYGSESAGTWAYDTANKLWFKADAIANGVVRSSFTPNTAPSTTLTGASGLEQDFSLTHVFPANSIVLGRIFEERKSFTYNATGTPTFNLKGYFGTNAYATTGAKTSDNNQSNGVIEVRGILSADSTTVMRYQVYVVMYGSSTTQFYSSTGTFAYDATSSQTWKWSVTISGDAGDTIAMTHDIAYF